MVWINQIIFWIPLVIAVVILLWLWRKTVMGKVVEKRHFRIVIIIILIVYILQVLGRIALLYYSLKNSQLGIYLLPGKGTNYFYTAIYDLIKPFVFALVTAVILALIVFVTIRHLKKPWFEQNDLYLIFITGFLVGFPGVLILLLATLILMVFWQLIFRIERISFAPFLIFVAILELILSNFSFYQKFLSFIHLV